MYRELKRLLFGAPIASQHEESHKLTIPIGLAVFSADALSSTAYATDEILIALSSASAAVMVGQLSLWVAAAIIALIAIVVISYRQVIRAYPDGGGAYVVAKTNLGVLPSQIAASALLIDYVLTVAVSVSAGVAAITATGILPAVWATWVCIAATIVMMLVNLRGIKESGKTFGVPAYVFVLGMLTLIATGCYQLWYVGGAPINTLPTASSSSEASVLNGTIVLLFLKAFSHGCAGLTGIEAVSNGVKAFKAPASDRANKTMLLMGTLLSVMFLGVTYLAYAHHIAPIEGQTIVSQVATIVFGEKSIPYYVIQGATMAILVLAANTAFADFPRVANLLANDGFLPRQLMNLGDRLVFNNGILTLGLLSSLLIWLYQGDTHSLIPLYAVGVFLSFTTSQSGMVKHHLTLHEPGWRMAMVINGFGALVTAVVTVVLAIEKFTDGAWIVFVAIPILVMLFRSVNAHYRSVARQMALDSELADCPVAERHRVLVLVSTLGKSSVNALHYAKSLSTDVEAVHVSLSEAGSEGLKQAWQDWGCGIPLTILPSPFRSITQPVLDYLGHIEEESPNSWVTVIVPEFVPRHWWHHLLHNQTAILLKTLLAFHRRKIVTTVRYYLNE